MNRKIRKEDISMKEDNTVNMEEEEVNKDSTTKEDNLDNMGEQVSYNETTVNDNEIPVEVEVEVEEKELTIEEIRENIRETKKYNLFGMISSLIGVLLTSAIVGIAVRFILVSKKVLGSEFTDLKLFVGITAIFAVVGISLLILFVKYLLNYINVNKEEKEVNRELPCVNTKTENI